MRLTFFICLLLALSGCGDPREWEAEETPTNADIVSDGGGDIVMNGFMTYRQIVDKIKDVCAPSERYNVGLPPCDFVLMADYCNDRTDRPLCRETQTDVRVPYLRRPSNGNGCRLCSIIITRDSVYNEALLATENISRTTFTCSKLRNIHMRLPISTCAAPELQFKD